MRTLAYTLARLWLALARRRVFLVIVVRRADPLRPWRGVVEGLEQEIRTL